MMVATIVIRISAIFFATIVSVSALDNQTATSAKLELETSKLVKCDVGQFGVLCDEDCHCHDGLACDADGLCPQGGACEPNYAGPTCSDCSDGHFGVNCSEICHCLNRTLGACDSITGECDDGCAAGYNGSSCQEITGFVRLELKEMPVVNSGQTVELTCSALGPSKPNIVMTSSSVLPLVNASDVVKDYHSDELYVANFVFGPIVGAASYEFECQVNNAFGSANGTISITVVDPPVLTVTPFVSPTQSLTSNSVGLAWNSWQYGTDLGGSDGDDVEYLVEYRPTGESEWSNSSDWHRDDNTVIDRLAPDTVYDFTVRCRRPGLGGEGQRGPVLQVVTKCGAPNNRGIPQNLTVVDASYDSLNLAWQPPAHADLKCELSKYVLRYSFVEHGDTKVERLEVDGLSVNFTLFNLTADTRYEISLTAVTDGPRALSYAFIVANTRPPQSGSSLVPAAVTNVTFVYQSDPTSIFVSWQPAIGRIREYVLTAELMAAGNCLRVPGDLEFTFHTVKTPNSRVMLSKLRPFSKYEVMLHIVSDSGLSEPTNITATTPKSSPSMLPPNLRISDCGPTFILFQWDAIPCHEINDDAVLYQYNVKRLPTRIKRSDVVTDMTKFQNASSGNYANVTDLQPHSLYEVAVRGVSTTGNGPEAVLLYSTTANFTLPSPTLGLAVLNSTAVLYTIVPAVAVATADLQYVTYELRITFRNGTRMGRFDSSKYIVLAGDVNEYVDKDVRVADHFVEACVRLHYDHVGWSAWSEAVISDPVNSSSSSSNNNNSRNISLISVLPNAPVIFTVKYLNSSTVAIQWRFSHDVGILKYKVQCVVVGDAAAANSNMAAPSWSDVEVEHDIETADGSTTRVIVGHLRTGFVYLVRVAAVSVNGHVGLWSNKTFFMEDDSSSRRVSLLLSPQPPPPLIFESQSSSKLDVVMIHITAVEDFYLYPKLMYYDVLVAMYDRKSDDLNGTLCGKYSAVMERLMDCWVAARLPAAFVEVGGHGLDFIIGDSNVYNGFFNGPLLTNQKYAIMMRTVDDKLESFSALSVAAIRSVFGVDGPQSRDSRRSGYCYVWEIPCVWFFVMVLVLVILFWILIACYMFCRMKNQKDMKVHHEKAADIDCNVSSAYRVSRFDATSIEMMPLNDTSARMETFKKSNFYGPIGLTDLAEYVNLRSTHPMKTFEEEFKRIVRGQSFTWIEAKKPENIKKNRYGNILPYDQTRVRLGSIPGISNSDYINASYVDGYDRPKFYIVTQGPKENTFHDFWRMIWQERTSIIVMLTALVENKKKKCDQYWPNLSRLYGDILVHLISTDYMADVIVRHFELKIVATSDVRRVTHYHYADWPDLSVPPSAMAVLSLRQAVRDELISNAGPIVVHCSGGAGRSGTFIAIDAMLKQAFDEDLVHVHNYINTIRTQRTNLVQTLDQYKFVYESLLEAVQSGNTKAPCGTFSDYFRRVHQKLTDDSSNLLEEQLETLDNFNRRMSSFPSVEALTTENACKNRDPTVLPIEYSRVKLKSTIPDTSSPYINAVFVDGFHQKGELLVTQMPLDRTIEDFWTMITEFKSTVVVMLNDCEFIDENTVPGQYWPNDGCTQYGDFLVEVVTFEEKGMLTVRKLRVTDVGAENSCGDPHFVIQLQFLDWTPDESVPSSTNSLVTAINTADVLRSKYGGPITVHCMDGASRSGLFAVSWLIKKQVIKGEVDVFQAVKRSRQHRPQFITSLKQYRFCYQVAMELVSSFGQNNFV